MQNISPIDTVRSVGPAAEPAQTQRAATGRATPETFVKFEAMVLQTFMQSILPKDTETVYGGGMAGDMWKSMLAQQLGEVMAQRGGIGIADRVLGDHYLRGDEKAPATGAQQIGANEPVERRQPPSAALVEKMERDIVKSLGHSLASAAANQK